MTGKQQALEALRLLHMDVHIQTVDHAHKVFGIIAPVHKGEVEYKEEDHEI